MTMDFTLRRAYTAAFPFYAGGGINAIKTTRQFRRDWRTGFSTIICIRQVRFN